MAPADRLRPASRTRLALAAVLLAAAGVLVILSRSKHADEPPERARSEHRGGDVPHLIEWSATPVDADAVWGVDGLATVFDMPASSISLGVPVVTRLRVDAAVHSHKDLPTAVDPRFTIAPAADGGGRWPSSSSCSSSATSSPTG